MGFDVEGARKAGYSEPEIVDHLAKQSNFDVVGAKKAGYSDAEILQHLSTAASAPESRGVAGEPATPAPVAAAAPGRQPRKGVLKNQPEMEEVQVPTMEELGQRWKGVAVGIPKGAVTAIPGLIGDVEGLVRKDPFFPTSHGIADYMFGPAASPYEAGGRAFGGAITGFATPGIAGRIGAIKEAAAAANYPKTATALRATQLAVDPLTPLLSGAVTLGGKTYNSLRDAANYAFAPGTTVANRLVKLTEDPERALAAMRSGEGTPISGGQMSLTELQAAGNVAEPRIAAAQAALAEGATAPQAQLAQQQRVAAIQSNLGNVEGQLQLATREMTPQITGDPAAVQAALEAQVVAEQAAQAQRVAAEEARLQGAGQSIGRQLPDPSQQAVGARLTEIAEAIAAQSRENVVRPAYRAVVAEGGDVPINIDRALDAAQRVRGSAAGLMDASAAPEGVRAIERFRADPLPPKFTPSIIPGLPGRTGAPIPQPSTVTTGDFMTVRAELAQDRSAASAAQNYTGARNIRQVMDELDAAFRLSPVSPRTLELFDEARGLHLSEVVERTGTGETAQMLQQNKYNRPGILPEDVAAAFLKSETPAQQFVTTFRNDPAAARTMGEGVSGLFREATMGADGLVDVDKATAFLRAHRRQLDILESSGVRVTDQLTAITEQAAANVRQRQALAERTAQQQKAFADSTAKLRGASTPEQFVTVALANPRDMDILLSRLNAGERAGLVSIVKNRVLDPIKAGNPDAAIELLTKNQDTIRKAIGQNQHTLLLNAAQVQKRLDALQGTVPREGLYDPKVLAAKFSPSQLADLNIANNDILRLQQVEKLAADGKGARVAAAPSPANLGALLSSISAVNPFAWARVLGGKVKNVMEARVAAEGVDVMYKNPQRYAAALEEAIKMKKRGEVAQKAARTISNNLISRPAASVSNELANRQAP
tara:strand:- start:198 stop:3014 length:2817 start_codon:yes stop_codon:yes gene_type:complete